MGPQEHKVERRLVAIFAADVAGYSPLALRWSCRLPRPDCSIFSLSASNVSGSAISGRALIRAITLPHTRCKCDWLKITLEHYLK
jgi:hypothetical protein